MKLFAILVLIVTCLAVATVKNFDLNYSLFVNLLLSVDSCGNIFVDMNYYLKIALFDFLLLHYQYQIAHFIFPDKIFMSDQ